MKKFLLLTALVSFSLPVQADEAKLNVEDGMGPSPNLPAPVKSLIPLVNIAPAQGWPAGEKPKPAAGLSVNAFAEDLDHPRWIYTLPNGDVLVAESDAPPKEENFSIKNTVKKFTMQKAGSGRSASANRITLLRDADNDGVAEVKTPFLENLHSPFGMALVGNEFYVANADAVVRFPYKTGETQIKDAGTKLADLPGGPRNHHWTKSLIASPDGSKLYVGVGSNSNVAENGMDEEINRAAILEIDRKSGETRVFASGLRNPVGVDWEPKTKILWTAVNERDELGSDLVPDYMTSVKDGGFYGWPYSYFGQHVDERVKPANPDLVAKAIVPDYALGPHTASLGLKFYTANLMPQYKGGVFIGQHGSWNRKPRSGYKVIYIPFENGKPFGKPQDILTGFLSADEKALGRPVGVETDKKGALLVADDVGNKIWRVVPAAASEAK